MFGPTVQGEGHMIGQQTYFIRLGGCDYACKLCDSLHAVDPNEIHNRAEWLTQDQLYKHFKDYVYKPGSTRWVTISGGNPAIHNLTRLCYLLTSNNFLIATETQGTIFADWLYAVDIITVSPKTPSMERFEPDIFQPFLGKLRGRPGLNVKVVIFNASDLKVATQILKIAEQYTLDYSRLFLSQGNPYIPYSGSRRSSVQWHSWHPGDDIGAHRQALADQYKTLFGLLSEDAYLNQFKFLPQLHVWLHGNQQGV
jgi:7-carboxy-7-deazaguanine synthase